MVIVAVPRETFPGEKRVALIPASIPPLVKAGLEVLVESGAGLTAGFPDRLYADKGAKIVHNRQEVFAADVLLQVRSAGANARRWRPIYPAIARGRWSSACAIRWARPGYADGGLSAMGQKTIFKQIINLELPANIVYEDERCLVLIPVNYFVLHTKMAVFWALLRFRCKPTCCFK